MEYSITKAELHKLYWDLCQKVKEKWDEIRAGDEFPSLQVDVLGISDQSKTRGHISVRTLLEAGKSDISEHGENETRVRYLYNLLRDFKTSNATWITAKVKKLEPFLTLAGYAGLDAFRMACMSERERVTYKCFYYSLTKLEVKKFILTLVKRGDGMITAATKGFHDLAPELELTGDIRVIDECLLIHTEKGKYFLDFTIHLKGRTGSEHGALPVSNVLQGLVSANSSYDFPLSLECVLLKEPFCNGAEKDNVSRYLFLKRNYHRVKAPVEKNDETRRMMVNRAEVDTVRHMADKTYRIWTYAADKQSVHQSRFVIESSYKATIFTPWEEELNCFITINYGANLRLLVPAYKRTALVVLAIMNVPMPTVTGEPAIVQGGYCTVGRLNNNPVPGYFVMMEEVEPGDLKACTFTAQELSRLTKARPPLKKLKEALDKASKNK